MLADRIECHIAVEAPPALAWTVLTEPRFVSRWYAFGGAELDLRPFGSLTFRWKERGTYHGLIATFEPPHALTFLCTCLVPDERPRVGNSTLVEFTVEAAGHLTRVRVVESGFRQLHTAEHFQGILAASARRSWGNGLELLRGMVERSAPVAR